MATCSYIKIGEDWSPGRALITSTDYVIFMRPQDRLEGAKALVGDAGADIIVPGYYRAKETGGYIIEAWDETAEDFESAFFALGDKIRCLEGLAISTDLLKACAGGERELCWETLLLLKLLYNAKRVTWSPRSIFFRGPEQKTPACTAALFNALSLCDLYEYFAEKAPDISGMFAKQAREGWARVGESKPEPGEFEKYGPQFLECSQKICAMK